MISDEKMNIRELGLRRLLKARKKPRKLRSFDRPKINFAATDYVDLIDWQNTVITPTPLLSKLSDDNIRAAILSGDPLEFEKLPCLTQAVERCVKPVTEASAAVCGTAARDGFIRVRNEARKKCQNLKPKTILLFKSLSV
jgi:hypothetical protein